MSSWGEKDEISKEKLNLVACLFVCAYVCTHVRVLVCSRYLCTPACACTCAYGSVGAHWCTSVCVRALGAVRVQKGVCSNCRLVAIPPLTSRWRECSGKVKASGAVLRAGVERGDPGLESTLCGSGGVGSVAHTTGSSEEDVQGQCCWLAAFPGRRSRLVSTPPLSFPISQRPSDQVYTSLKRWGLHLRKADTAQP